MQNNYGMMPHNDKTIRLVAARSARKAENEPAAERMLQQRWRMADIQSAMQGMVETAHIIPSWTVVQHLEATDIEPTAYLRHLPSADVIKLGTVFGHGQNELQAMRQKPVDRPLD